jgi:hypothetical protein
MLAVLKASQIAIIEPMKLNAETVLPALKASHMNCSPIISSYL